MTSKQKIVVVALVILLMPSATAELDAEIAESCKIDYEPLISMANPASDTNNPGAPDVYKYKVCVRGIAESTFSTSCKKNVGFYMSSKGNAAHFSTQNSYYWHVCTGKMKTRVTTGPKYDNETKLFSVSSLKNAHIAEPDFFKYNVYGLYATPENVTLSLTFNLSSNDDVYFDNERVDGESTFTPPAEFPYIVSESNSLVSGIISPNFRKAERKIVTKNRISFTEKGDSSFILPFTSGSHIDIEDKQGEILDRSFLDSISPNFGFAELDSPVVKIRFQNQNVSSDLSLSSGIYRLNITKTGENKV